MVGEGGGDVAGSGWAGAAVGGTETTLSPKNGCERTGPQGDRTQAGSRTRDRTSAVCSGRDGDVIGT